MTSDERYDWWAAEGRPEHLRPLLETGERLMDDSDLESAGIVVEGFAVDEERELLTVEVTSSADASAERLIRERYGPRIEVTVTSPDAVERVVPWESWTRSDDPRQIDIWWTGAPDTAPSVDVEERGDSVVVTVRDKVWPGATTTLGVESVAHVALAAPIGDRDVVDGSTRVARREGRPTH